MSAGFWTSNQNDSVQPSGDRTPPFTNSDLSSLSPFASMSWRELDSALKNMTTVGNTADGAMVSDRSSVSSRSPEQLANNGSRFDVAQNRDAGQRSYTVGPTQLMPNEIFDVQASLDAQSSVGRSLRWLRENAPEEATGISSDIIDEETIQRIVQGIHGARDLLVENLPPGRNPPLLQMGLGSSIFEHAQQMFPNDPQRQRTEIGVQLALLGRSFNQELERLGSPVRLGPLQVGVSQDGHTFFGLPVRHNGVQTNILRFPPLPSPQELQRRRDSIPRNT